MKVELLFGGLSAGGWRAAWTSEIATGWWPVWWQWPLRRAIEQQSRGIDPDRRWSIRWPICRLAAARENLDDHHPAATARVCGPSRAPSLGRCALHGAVRAISERL